MRPIGSSSGPGFHAVAGVIGKVKSARPRTQTWVIACRRPDSRLTIRWAYA
jgi:hypothetical protein